MPMNFEWLRVDLHKWSLEGRRFYSCIVFWNDREAK